MRRDEKNFTIGSRELQFEKRVCSVCGKTFEEMNIEGVNPRSLCDKCLKKEIKIKRGCKNEKI